MKRLVKDLLENRHALQIQLKVNTKTTVATTKLGTLWWILDPLILMMTYYFVVKVIFNRGGPNYHLSLLCGLVTYQFFSHTVSACTRALATNENLIKQASLPMILYLVIPPLVQTLFCLIGYVIIMIWNYPALGLHTLAIIFPVLLAGLLIFTLGLYLSIFEVYIKDTGKIVGYILRFGLWMCPILYSVDRIYDNPNVPQYAKVLYSLNPMVHIITAVKDILFFGKMFDPIPLLWVFLGVLLFMQLGLLFFRKASPYIPKLL